MKNAFFFAAVLATAVSTAQAIDINGWYPCGPTTKPRESDGVGDVPDYRIPVGEKPKFECAQVPLPMCYDGLCTDDGEVMHVFVKRMVAKNDTTQSGKKPKAIWFVQGGPSQPSTSLEPLMYSTYKDLNGTVSVYTMDQRGTGRSNYLQCVAAQVDTDGSIQNPWNYANRIMEEEMPACVKDLNFQYKNKAAAFSITSVAMDHKAIIEGLQPNEDVYVHGFSYGTTVAQRLIQLQPSGIKGYIFEGMSVITTKHDKIQTQWSREDELLREPTRRLLEACFDDPECPLKFKSRDTVVDEVLELYKKLDDEVETNLCSQFLIQNLWTRPSDALRGLIQSFWIYGTGYVENIPLAFAKLKTCSQADLDAIGPMFDPFYGQSLSASNQTSANATRITRRLQNRRGSDSPDVVDPLRQANQLLGNLLIGSELYGPPPSIDELKSIYHASPFGQTTPLVAEYVDEYKNDLDLYGYAPEYCRSTGSNEEICQQIKPLLPDSPTFYYEIDKYYDAPLKLSESTSALMLTGGLDFRTPAEHGDIMLDKLQGGRGKLSVMFKYGSHCRGEATHESMEMPCRNSIVKQYVMSDGDVAKIDQSCLKEHPKPVFPTVYKP